VGLTAAIWHDAGYIRRDAESKSSGAHFRAEHERRGMSFVSRHGEAIGLTEQEIADCRSMIRGTMMAEDVNAMPFRSRTQELLVRMLSVADLLAQLSSATYLERLLFLYDEDRDSKIPQYRDLLDCYHKAIAFDDRARARLRRHLEQTDAYLAKHFSARWDTPANLYRISMDNQMQFLTVVIARDGFEPRRHLRRWGSLQALQRLMSENHSP
jgi:hypothetical protein